MTRKFGASMRKVLCYLLSIPKESSRSYRDIIEEGFNEKITHNSKNRIIASINRLVSHGLVTERKNPAVKNKRGTLKFWALTEKGREAATQLAN